MGAVSRVVFVHGLESGPFGKKTQQMRKAGFDVRATQMPCGLPELSLRVLGLDPLLTSSLLFFGVAVVFAFGWVGFAAVLVAVLLAWSIRPRWLVQLLVQRMLNRCVEVQERFLALLDDCEGTTVYVGSSFGGAVLFELMRHGKINGMVFCMLLLNLIRNRSESVSCSCRASCGQNVRACSGKVRCSDQEPHLPRRGRQRGPARGLQAVERRSGRAADRGGGRGTSDAQSHQEASQRMDRKPRMKIVLFDI
jgi:hypothetical protein